MSKPLAIVGVPSSAGAYAPGQEKAPEALRAAGLIGRLLSNGIEVRDFGNTTPFRWQADTANPRMMNHSAVVQAATETACLVDRAVREHANVLVLGGDCSIELGVVAGFRSSSESIGLIYADLDTDLQTPLSTQDGAFDWMGVAHLLGVEGTAPELAMMGPTFPLLSPDEVFLFGHKNVKEPERRLINSLGIKGVHADEVAADPEGAAWYAALEWGARFDRLLIHFDVDLIDFESFPIAENTRRKMGLSFEQAMRAVRTLLQARNWASLTVTEVNPDHGHVDGTTIRTFVDRLSSVLASRQAA